MPAKSREEILQQDLRDLHRLGYAQQLFREMGGFSNFAISFSIISILTGAILLFGFGLRFAGPIVNSVLWPVVSLFVLMIAASMAELASAYPTAGGLYFWAYRLGGRQWAWTTAWFNMIGQVTTTAGVNIGVAIYLVGAITRMLNLPANATIPFFGTIDNWYFYVFVMVLVTIPQALINILGIKITARLNNVSVWWHIGGVVLIALALTLWGKTHHPLSYAFQFVKTTNPYDFSSAEITQGVTAPALYLGNPITQKPLLVLHSPLFALFPGLAGIYRAAPLWLVLGIGLLQAQWTYTGYDASAHMAEETCMARLNCAWGIFLSVAVSAIVGYAMLMVLTLSITDIPSTATDAYPVLKIVYDNLPLFCANLIAVVIAGAMWLCGLSCITSMSRMWFAFARDGGMPGHTFIKRIHPKWRTPVNSILVTCALAVLMLLWSGAYYVVTAICVIMLYWAYGIPVFLNLRNKLRRQGEFTTRDAAPWNLGKWGPVLNSISVLWIAVISMFLVLPPNELVLWTTVLIGVFMFLYWNIDVRKRFRGPRRQMPRNWHASSPGPPSTTEVDRRAGMGFVLKNRFDSTQAYENLSAVKKAMTKTILTICLATSFGLGLTTALAADKGKPSIDVSKLPPASTKTDVTFAQDIKPIFEKSCVGCHGPEKAKGKLRLDSLPATLKGGEDGKVVEPKESANSVLIHNVAHLGDPDDYMPPPKNKGNIPPLTPEQIGLIRAWIDQGAK